MSIIKFRVTALVAEQVARKGLSQSQITVDHKSLDTAKIEAGIDGDISSVTPANVTIDGVSFFMNDTHSLHRSVQNEAGKAKFDEIFTVLAANPVPYKTGANGKKKTIKLSGGKAYEVALTVGESAGSGWSEDDYED